MDKYLRPTDVIDYNHPDVQDLSHTLGDGISEQTTIAKRCFEWVRDEIKHSGDFKMNPTTCAASEVLRHKTGWCFAKSHLLAALLRANRIPAGLCYQRLTRNGKAAPFTLHGLNAVLLPEFGWYRIDPRGNRSGIDAQFDPPNEKLAWLIAVEGEKDLRGVWADPLPPVVAVLRNYDTWRGFAIICQTCSSNKKTELLLSCNPNSAVLSCLDLWQSFNKPKISKSGERHRKRERSFTSCHRGLYERSD